MEEKNNSVEELMKASDLECEDVIVEAKGKDTTTPKKKKSPKSNKKNSTASKAAIEKKFSLSVGENKLTSKSLTLSPAQAKAPVALFSRSLTKPISPKFKIEKRLKEHARSVQHLSSEDLQLAKIAAEQDSEKKRILKAQKLYQQMKASGFTAKAVKSSQQTVKKPTIPRGPKSVLDKRLGSKVPSALRKSPKKTSPKKSPRKLQPTIPVPFHFKTDERLKSTPLDGTACSLTAGEMAQKFFQDPRSHYVPDTAGKKLTEAHSPVLHTMKRLSHNASKMQSYEERIEEEMSEILKHSFKARPLDKRIFESNGELGVPKVEAKPLTVPLEFQLASDKRAIAHNNKPKKEESEPATTFKALPLPASTREPLKPSTPPSKMNFKPTVPVSPKLHGGERASSAPARRQKPHHKEVEKQRQEEELAWKKKSGEMWRRLTHPQEFHLLTSERGAAYQQMMEEYAKQEAELAKEQAALKALPLPDLSKAFHPRPSDRAPTTPAPFELKSAALHEESAVKMQMNVEKEKQEMRKSVDFKAKPVPKTLYEAPQQGGEENRPPTVPLNIILASDKRAEKRQQFDKEVQQKALVEQMEKEKADKEREEAEQREVMVMRRKSVAEGGMVFKAKPVLRHDPFQAKTAPQSKPPTLPKSPNLRLKERRGAEKEKSAEGEKKGKRPLRASSVR